MKKLNETNNCTSYTNEDNTKFANIVRNLNNGRHFKVITKDENGKIETIATRCDYNTAEALVKEFLA